MVNADTAVANVNQSSGETDFDVVVIGAGFAGLYALHRCREMGFRTVSLEKADSVGGTWLFNRYPGARCDIESIEYSYSFSEEIQQEWVWTENMPAQPEIEAYLNFVADRLDLRRDIKFTTHVVAMQFSDTDAAWTIRTEGGGDFFHRWLRDRGFGGDLVRASRTHHRRHGVIRRRVAVHQPLAPRDKVSFANKRVGIIGTGSTGVQAIPVVAREAAHLTVFQRSPAYTLPWEVRSLDDGELDEMKARYPEIRAAQREHFVGAARLTAFSFMLGMMERPRLLATSEEERQRAVEDDGVKGGALNWSDVFTDMEANDLARRLYGRAIARIVTNPDTAASLVPSHAFGCKRPIIDQGTTRPITATTSHWSTCARGALKRVIPPTGIETEQGTYDIDVIIFATGFDAMTGALTKMDIRGRWGSRCVIDGAATAPAPTWDWRWLASPPICSSSRPPPAAPAPSSNYIAVMEANVEWITDCLAHLRHRGGHRTIEATAQAQQEWMEHTTSMVKGSLFTHPSCNSWYNGGGNVAGKKKMYMGYIAGGVPEYRRRCDVAAANGYAGFDIDSAPST